MEECASIIHVTSDKKKAGLLLWFVNLFWSIFSFSSQTFCCFFLEAFGIFGIFWPSKGLTAFLRPKNPKKASGLQKKTKCLQASAENTPKKVNSSWKNACFLFIFGPISYWRAFFHDTIHFILWFNFLQISGKAVHLKFAGDLERFFVLLWCLHTMILSRTVQSEIPFESYFLQTLTG